MCEGRKPKRNKTKKADLQEKSRGGEKEGTDVTAGKEKKKNIEFLNSVQQGKLVEEECRKKPRGNYQEKTKKPCGADISEKKTRHKKTTLADRNRMNDNCVEKSPQDAFMTKRRTNKVDKSKNLSDARKEDSQRKMKLAEELEVKALDTWKAVRDIKRRAKEKEKMAERPSSNEEVFGHRKEEAREQNVQKSAEFQSVECSEKERRPKKKLQLLDEIMKMNTDVEPSDCNKNPIPGRKERHDHTTHSEQMFEKKRSDEKIQRTPNRKRLVTIPREDHLKQVNSPPTLNAKTVRSIVSPVNHIRGQKPCGQPLNGPVKVPARPLDSPYLSDIRQRGDKFLSTHQPSSNTKPVAVYPSKQGKSHCNFPEIYGSIKQARTDASSSSSSDRIPVCSAMRLSPYNKPGRPPATRIHVPPYIPTEATTDQIAKKTTTRAPTAREMIRIPQSSEKIQNFVQTTNLQAKSKATVDRTKVLVISQSKRETTVSIRCCIQKKVDDERPLLAGKTNRNTNSQKFSAYKTGTSKGSPSSRKLPGRRQHGS